MKNKQSAINGILMVISVCIIPKGRETRYEFVGAGGNLNPLHIKFGATLGPWAEFFYKATGSCGCKLWATTESGKENEIFGLNGQLLVFQRFSVLYFNVEWNGMIFPLWSAYPMILLANSMGTFLELSVFLILSSALYSFSLIICSFLPVWFDSFFPESFKGKLFASVNRSLRTD